MRVVSLLASATEIVCALGAGDMLVGRSHECDNPSWVRRLPACSSPAFDVSISSSEIDVEVRRRLRAAEPLYHVHAELIHELHPDLLITQAHCEVCAVTPGDVERSGAGESATRQVALSASCLEEIFDGIFESRKQLGLEDRGARVWSEANDYALKLSERKQAVFVGQRWSRSSGQIQSLRWAIGVPSWLK